MGISTISSLFIPLPAIDGGIIIDEFQYVDVRKSIIGEKTK